MLQLVCIDVDGTLIGESGEPTNGVLDAIMHARSLGQTLALSTARGAMGPTADYASLLNPMVAYFSCGCHCILEAVKLLEKLYQKISSAWGGTFWYSRMGA